MLVQEKRTLEIYLQHLSTLRLQTPESVQKQSYALLKIQAELGRSVLETSRASEINQAIFAAADHRKAAYNGGHRDKGEGMRHRLGGVASRYVTWAFSEGYIERNHYPVNPFPKPRKREAGFLGDEQLALVLRAPISTEDQALIRVFMDTGLRVSELCRLNMTDVNMATNTIKASVTKTDQPKIVAIHNTTKYWLSIYLSIRGHETPCLFVNRYGKRLTPWAIRKRFRAISKDLGFRIHPHKLRHTAGTLLIQENEQVLVMRYLGHSSPEMTAHYIHLTGKSASKMVDRVHKAKPFFRGVVQFERAKIN